MAVVVPVNPLWFSCCASVFFYVLANISEETAVLKRVRP